MTEKWADYVIVGVNYSKDLKHKHIENVKIYEDTGDKLSNVQKLDREKVISLLDSRKTIITATEKDEKYKRGADVYKFKDIYIKTEKDGIEEDNLGELPTF